MAKQYGLITKDNKVIPRPSIFNEDSDSNDDQDKPTGITVLKKKERMAQQKAIDEDPTIYQYDELYDDMQSKRKESKLARKDLDRKPKYINKLLESAERRKKEYERRIERDVQKEREAEGDLYKDKESFVTSAYRKKLEEMKELEEKEKREEYLEAIGDVKKQGDLSGFYRHLYAQQVNYDENSVSEKKTEDTSKKSEDTSKKNEESSSTPEEPPKLKETSKWETSETSEEILAKKTDEQKDTTVPSKKLLDNKKRKYRKREDSKSDEEPEKEEEKKLHHIQSNLDADSDFSIDSESDSDSESETKKQKTETNEENKVNASTETQDSVKVEENKEDADKKEEKTASDDKKDEPVVPKKPKIDIWKKRTVGEVFDEALKRYYERKAGRMQTVN